jgi:hypothetical protein
MEYNDDEAEQRAKCRKFMMAQVRKSAAAGDPISASLLALESDAHAMGPHGSFAATDMQDWSEDDSDILE